MMEVERQCEMNGAAVQTPRPQLRVIACPTGENEDWDAYVTRHPEATAYHLFGWRSVIEESYGHRTFYMMAYRDRDLVGVLPLVLIASRLFRRCLVSLPFLDYGGILADDPATERLLIEEAIRLAGNVQAAHVELRHSRRKELGLVCQAHKVSMRLDLPHDPQQLWNGLPSKVRSQIRRAQKEGFATRIGGAENVDHFYRVFAENMRDLGTPVHAKQFFHRILDRLSTISRLCIMLQGQTPVAAAFFVRFNSDMEVQWASSLKRFNPSSPNMLLYWSMLEYACSEEIRRFDFGRSSPGSGTYRFKAQWGATPTQLYWDYWLAPGESLPALNYANPRYTVAIRIWRRLPLAIANRLGPRIIKYVPA